MKTYDAEKLRITFMGKVIQPRDATVVEFDTPPPPDKPLDQKEDGALQMKVTVKFTHDPDARAVRCWAAQVLEHPDAIAQGSSLKQARTRIREALALLLDDPAASNAEIQDLVVLPRRLRGLITQAKKLRARREKIEQKESALVRVLVENSGLETKELAALMDADHQTILRVYHVLSQASRETIAARDAFMERARNAWRHPTQENTDRRG